jgi:xanthine/uracil/vitamin C permease (AzgA family)
MAKFAGLRDPVTFDFEGSSIAYCVDAFCIVLGALFGSSPVTAYIESATGISGMTIYRTPEYNALTLLLQRVARQD